MLSPIIFRGPRRRAAVPTLVALGVAVGLFFAPTSAAAQACAAGTLSTYLAPQGPNACTISGVTLSWGQYAMQGPLSRINVTPFSGINGLGNYFGFRFQANDGAPLVSAAITAADGQVWNPNYNPNDPSQGPEFFPYLQQATTSGFLGWQFTHSLVAPNAIKRLELNTSGVAARSVSQPIIDPSYNLAGEPDVNTGCGWSIFDPNSQQQFNAASRCGYLSAVSNNFLWRGVSDGTSTQAVRSSSGKYGVPDLASAYCEANQIGVPMVGGDCASFQDLTGINFGSSIQFGSLQQVGTMELYGQSAETGLIDPALIGNYNASASLDSAEFRVYYTPDVIVPEPGTWLLLSVGLVLIGFAAHRRRGQRAA